MAAYQCDLKDDQPVAFIIGDANTGEQMFLCAGDAARFGLQLAMATLPLEEITGEVGSLAASVASNGQEGAGEMPARKSKRSKKAASKPDEGTEQRLQETPAGAADE